MFAHPKIVYIDPRELINDYKRTVHKIYSFYLPPESISCQNQALQAVPYAVRIGFD